MKLILTREQELDEAKKAVQTAQEQLEEARKSHTAAGQDLGQAQAEYGTLLAKLQSQPGGHTSLLQSGAIHRQAKGKAGKRNRFR